MYWHGGSLKERTDKTLSDQMAYGGAQVLNTDIKKMQVTFIGHRGFAPDGSTIYYIATDASVKKVADKFGVTFVNKTGAALLSGGSSDLYVFTNGIKDYTWSRRFTDGSRKDPNNSFLRRYRTGKNSYE